MRVKAKVNLKYNGEWKAPGEIFEVNPGDAGIMDCVEEIADGNAVETVGTCGDLPEPEYPAKRRGRPPKREDT